MKVGRFSEEEAGIRVLGQGLGICLKPLSKKTLMYDHTYPCTISFSLGSSSDQVSCGFGVSDLSWFWPPPSFGGAVFFFWVAGFGALAFRSRRCQSHSS